MKKRPEEGKNPSGAFVYMAEPPDFRSGVAPAVRQGRSIFVLLWK